MNPIKQQITIAEACDWFGIENHNGLSAFGSWKGYHPEHANSIGSPQPMLTATPCMVAGYIPSAF